MSRAARVWRRHEAYMLAALREKLLLGNRPEEAKAVLEVLTAHLWDRQEVRPDVAMTVERAEQEFVLTGRVTWPSGDIAQLAAVDAACAALAAHELHRSDAVSARLWEQEREYLSDVAVHRMAVFALDAGRLPPSGGTVVPVEDAELRATADRLGARVEEQRRALITPRGGDAPPIPDVKSADAPADEGPSPLEAKEWRDEIGAAATLALRFGPGHVRTRPLARQAELLAGRLRVLDDLHRALKEPGGQGREDELGRAAVVRRITLDVAGRRHRPDPLVDLPFRSYGSDIYESARATAARARSSAAVLDTMSPSWAQSSVHAPPSARPQATGVEGQGLAVERAVTPRL